MKSPKVTNVPGQVTPSNIPQLTGPQLAVFILLPVSWWFIVLYLILPNFLSALSTPEGDLNGWGILFVPTLGYVFEFSLALFIFHREGYPLRLGALHNRIHWHWPRGWRVWGLISILFVLGFGSSQLMQPLSIAIANVLPPPDWFPATQNPLKAVHSLEEALPGVLFKGNYLFLLLVLFSGTLNIVGEDLYYRGALIPKLHGLFGRWAWAAGGLIWMLKHCYVWWRFIADASALGFVGAYIFGPLGSLPVVMLIHFISNFGMSWPLIIRAVLFGG